MQISSIKSTLKSIIRSETGFINSVSVVFMNKRRIKIHIRPMSTKVAVAHLTKNDSFRLIALKSSRPRLQIQMNIITKACWIVPPVNRTTNF